MKPLHLQVSTHLRTHLRQIVRFGLVGVATYLLTVWTFELLYGQFCVRRRMAATLAYVAGVVAHFVASKLFTFSNWDIRFHRQVPRYALLCLVNYLITMAIFECIVSWHALSTTLAFALAFPVTTIITYLTLRNWVFAHDRE